MAGMKILVAIIVLAAVSLDEVHSLNCRNGVNTTIYGIEVYSWNEAFTCTSTSDQSCFITEVTHTAELLGGQEMTLYYGSCVSTSYASFLQCDQLYGADSNIDMNTLMNLFPDAEAQIDDFIALASAQIAKRINDTVGGRNSTELLSDFVNKYTPIFLNKTLEKLEMMNMTVPQEVVDIIMSLMNGKEIDYNPIYQKLLNNTLEHLEMMNVTLNSDVIDHLRNLPEYLEMMNDTMIDRDLIYEKILNKSLAKLESMNITLPSEVVDFLTNLPEYLEMMNSTNMNTSTIDYDLIYEKVLNKTLEKLASMNITLSAEVRDFLTNLPEYISMMNSTNMNTSMIDYDLIYEKVLNKTLEKLASMNITLPAEVMDFLTNLPEYISMMNGTMMNDSIGYFDIYEVLNNTLVQLEKYNITLQNETLARLYLVADLIDAYVMNDTANATAIMMQLWMNFQDKYCMSTNVTQAFAEALLKDLNDSGLNISDMYMPMFECIPGYLLTRYPNHTDEINMVFEWGTIALNNMTMYLEMVFAQINMTVPPELVNFVEFLDALTAARNNETEIMIIVENYIKELAQPTELSELTITILNKYNVNVTDMMITMVRLQSLQFYYQNTENVTATADIIFASLNQDITAGEDYGPAIVNAFGKTTIELPGEVQFLLLNIQPVIDAGMTISEPNGDLAFNQAILDLMEAYAAVYPSAQLDLQIASQKLRITFMNENSTTEEIASVFGEVFNLTLVVFNTTRAELQNMITETFPGLENFVQLISDLRDDETIRLGAQFVEWLLDDNRNVTTLVPIINETIHIILDRRGINLQEVLLEFLGPNTCKHEICDINSCNVPELLENATVYTTPPVQSTAVDTSSTTTTTTTTTTVATNTTTTSPVVSITTTSGVSTTSGAETVVTTGVSSIVLLCSAFLSLKHIL